MKKVLTAVALATILSASAWAQNLAVVNGKAVPSSRAEAMAAQIEQSGRPVDEATLGQIKDHLTKLEVFAQAAEQQGIKAKPEYKQAAELALQQVLVNELFIQFQRKNPVSEAEIKAEYDKFVASNTGKEFRARHILVETEAEAQALIAQIKGGASFEELAKNKSKDPGSGANGGDLDWANPSNYVPEFSAAMQKLDKGQLTDAPVKSQFGWHIIRVDDIRTAQLPPIEQFKPQIQQHLGQQKLTQYREQLLKAAKRSNAPASVNGKPLSKARVDAMLAQLERSGRPVDDQVKAQVTEHLLDLETFVQAAGQQGIKTGKGYEQKATIALQQVMAALMFAEQQKKTQVSDADVKSEYDRFAAGNPGQQLPPLDQIKPQIVQALAQQKVMEYQENLIKKARVQ